MKFPETPAETAKILVEEKFPIERYEQVQARRKERLTTWNTAKIIPMIERETKLIAFGDEVLKLMKEAYSK